MSSLLAVLLLGLAPGMTPASRQDGTWLELVRRDCDGVPTAGLQTADQAAASVQCRDLVQVRIPVATFDLAVRSWPDTPINQAVSATSYPEKPGWPKTIAGLEARTLTVARLESVGPLTTLFNLYDGEVFAFHPNGLAVPTWTGHTLETSSGVTLAAGDLDLDGLDEIIIPQGQIHVLSPTGRPLPGWPFTLPPGQGFNGQIPIVASFRPGEPPAVVSMGCGPLCFGGLVPALDRDGSLLPGWPVLLDGPVPGNVAVGDVDGDGIAEIVGNMRSSNTVFTALVSAFDHTGRRLPGFPSSLGNSMQEPTLGDLDGDGAMEIVMAGSPPSPDLGQAGVIAIRGDGTVVPGWPRGGGAASNWGVALGDVDGDGHLELAASTVNGGGAGAGVGRVNLWNDDGTYVPGWPIMLPGISLPAPIVIADVTGDGEAEIIASGLRATPPFDGVIYAWSANAHIAPGFPIVISGRPVGIASGPTVADIDGDGVAELGVMSEAGLFAITPARVHWFDLGVPYRPEGMEWPTRAHDMARTGAYAPPVKGVEMELRVTPAVIPGPAGPQGVGPRVTVQVRRPEDEAQPLEALSLVAVDGRPVARLAGHALPPSPLDSHPAPGRPLFFRFDGAGLVERIGSPGPHTLTFASPVISLGFGGMRFEGQAEVRLLR